MAETAVFFVIDKLLPFVTAEADFLGGLPAELTAINNELSSIRIFLKDAERRAYEDDGIKEWVRQVRRIAYQIEDVIDEYMILQHRHDIYRSDHSIQRLCCLHNLRQCLTLLLPKHRIANSIRSIHSEILEISRRRGSLSLDRCLSPVIEDAYANQFRGMEQDPRAGFLYVDESELVGIDNPKREIMALLELEYYARFTKGKVISVVGMGGIGKTTLVRKVFEEPSVAKNFPLRAWITLSKPQKSVDLWRNIIKQFYRARGESIPFAIDSMDEDFLVDELRNYAQQQRFLVVFDDVWDIETYIKDVLPTIYNGNRILVTTRLEDVALAWKGSHDNHVYKLEQLSQKKAWELFCRKAFRAPEARCPPELEKLSHDIVAKCEGLPLAIVNIGGLLSSKNKNVTEWLKLSNSMGVELENNRHLARIKKILLLSYHDLPHYLKPCFLYMGIFPGDRSIHCKRLLRLWIAEGFIPNMPGKSLEVIAEEYLIELIRRSLVQVNSTDVGGRCTGLRVHDLLREIILLKSVETGFCQVLDKNNSILEGQTRRLVIQYDKMMSSTKLFDETFGKKSGLRSLFLFEGSEALPKFITESFFKSTHLLKVLDLQDAPINQIPEATGCLYQLRYLSLRRTKVKELPRSIGKLRNLQTLDLKHTPSEKLPSEISRLYKLRHLISYNYHWDDTFSFHMRNVKAAIIPAGVCNNCLEMQNLGWVDANHSVGFVDQLENLKQLTRLGIAQLKREDGRKLSDAVRNMNQLQVLMIASRNKDEVLDLDHMSCPPPMLRRLLLMGQLVKLPPWIPKLQSVVKLVLCHSSLKDDLLEDLGVLPNLMKLILSEAYDGVQLNFGANRFQKLKVLRLYSLRNLVSLGIEPETLPLLEELQLGPSPQLREVPKGIKYLKNLALLRFHDMPKEFSDAIMQANGQHYHIIEHIPNVYVNASAGAGSWETVSIRYPQELKRMTLWAEW